METGRADAMLMEILQERKTITGFLDAIFGFLRRNTDFYHIKKNSNETIGFERGLKEQLTLAALQRYDPECQLNVLSSKEVAGTSLPPVIKEIEVETTQTPTLKDPAPSTSNHSANASEDIIMDCISSSSVKKDQKPIPIFSESDYRNGACFENYCWSQTLKDVELCVHLQKDIRSAKMLDVEINADSIHVYRRSPTSTDILLSGKLDQKFKYNEAIWTIDEDKLVVTFDKYQVRWWERLFTTEPSIDVTKVDCERYIDELPQESQAAIQKLCVEQQKRENAKEKKKISQDKLEKLRQAWNEEGSPFKGTPFDPSRIDFR